MPLSRISSQAIANNTIISADVVDYSLANTKLANTSVLSAGASRGTYGGGTSSQVIVPVITVANSGQIFVAANQTLSLTTFGGITATSFSTSGVLIGSSITSNSSVTGSSFSGGSFSGTDITGTSLTVNGTTTLQQAKEKVTVTGTGASGAFDFDVLTQAIIYFNGTSSGNFPINVRGNSGTSLNSLMSTGQSITVAVLNTNGATGYYMSSVSIDGTTVGVTARWAGVGAPTGGNTNAIDAYVLTIIKTGNATFTVLGSQTKFA